MSKEKEIKTNAMRLLDKKKIPYRVVQYDCDAFTDGVTTAQHSGIPAERSFKTLVTQGKSGNYCVFVIPVALELDLKAAARAVGEKSVEMIHVKDINKVTGYIRGGCSPLGMKKQYKTVLDIHAEAFDEIAVSGGRIGSTILLSPKDLALAVQAKTAAVTMPEKDCPYPYEVLTGEQIEKKLEVSRIHAEQGNLLPADEVLADKRERYGL